MEKVIPPRLISRDDNDFSGFLSSISSTRLFSDSYFSGLNTLRSHHSNSKKMTNLTPAMINYLKECGPFIRERIVEFLGMFDNPAYEATLEVCKELAEREKEDDND